MGLTVNDMPVVDRDVAEDAPRTIRGSTQHADCVNCPFSKVGRPNQPVTGEGWERPNWIIVGESPGGNEVIQQKPFVGVSGRLVNSALAKLGVAREALWVTNAVACQPHNGATDAEKKLARQACAPRLKHELAQFPGKPILALGAIAGQGFCGDKFSITQMAGAFYEVDVDGSGTTRPVIPSIHPAAILRGGSAGGGGGSHTSDLAYWNLLYDMQKVNLLAQGRDIKFTDDIQIELEDPQRAEDLLTAFVADVQRLKKFACDTETYVENPKQHTALSPFNAKMSAIGLATPERGISIAWSVIEQSSKARNMIASLFYDESITTVFHNRVYDVPVLQQHGFVIRGRIECTMLMHHSAFPGLAHNLQRVATQFYAIKPWKAEFRAGKGTSEELLTYNCLMAGTPVVLADGSTALIERLVNQRTPAKVQTWSAEKGIHVAQITGWHRTRVVDQKWLAIRTAANCKSDRGIVLTPDHEVFLENGSIRADQVKVGQCIATPEVAWSAEQQQAVIGTLLGDTILTVMPSYRNQRDQAPTMAMAGGHVEESRLAQWKVACLAPHGQLSVVNPAEYRVISGRTADSKPFQHYRTKDLHQLALLWPLLYDHDGTRRLRLTTVKQMGDIGLAWWFMDEGCKQNGRRMQNNVRNVDASHKDTVCISACRYSKVDVDVVKAWLTDEFGGPVYAGADCVFRFSFTATENFCARIAPYLADGMRYKLPRWFKHKHLKVRPPASSTHAPVYAKIVSVLPVTQVTTNKKSNTYRMSWRYCLTVPKTHNFFTSFGLVANCRDTLATARIEGPISVIVKRSNAEKTYEIDLQMAKAASIMHLKGVPIDKDVNEQLRSGFKAHIDQSYTDLYARVMDEGVFARFQERLAFEQARKQRKHDSSDVDERIQSRLGDMAKKPFKFMINAGDHVVAFLKATGVPLSMQTPSGRISTKKDILEAFVQYPEIRALLTYRENAKLLSTYIERMFDRPGEKGKVRYGYTDHNSRVHPRWSVHAITGRWRSEAPVQQNVPKADKKKGRPNLRSQVVAPHGRMFTAFDAAQLEARLIALKSGDPFLLNIFHQNKDIHSEFARIVWPDFDSVEVSERKVRRDMIKRPEYGAFYAGSVETLWKSVVRDYPNVTISMIGKMVAMMKSKMPGVLAWHQNEMRAADRDGEVRSMILGRRRCFPIQQFDLSEVVNFGIQASGADLINLGLAEILPQLPPTAFPILQIHDALVFEHDEDDTDLIKALVIKCFTREVTYNGNTMKFPVDARSGKSWDIVN